MKSGIREIFDHANGTRLQNAHGLSTKPRFRSKSLQVQLQEALLFAESLGKVKGDDDAAISRMKLAQTRIVTLQWLLKRKEGEKSARLNKVLAELAEAHRTIEKLKNDLTTALATKPARVLDSVSLALQQADQEKKTEE
jgi:hypothetical protein